MQPSSSSLFFYLGAIIFDDQYCSHYRFVFLRISNFRSAMFLLKMLVESEFRVKISHDHYCYCSPFGSWEEYLYYRYPFVTAKYARKSKGNDCGCNGTGSSWGLFLVLSSQQLTFSPVSQGEGRAKNVAENEGDVLLRSQRQR